VVLDNRANLSCFDFKAAHRRIYYQVPFHVPLPAATRICSPLQSSCVDTSEGAFINKIDTLERGVVFKHKTLYKS